LSVKPSTSPSNPISEAPALGLFGVRHNEQVKNDIRQTPGRYVGKARDSEDRECLVMVLSTREQHIRKDRATSNICSNQAFLATIAGASILARGDDGLGAAIATARQQAVTAVRTFDGASRRCPRLSRGTVFQ
jgi:glycine dehydrogenase